MDWDEYKQLTVRLDREIQAIEQDMRNERE